LITTRPALLWSWELSSHPTAQGYWDTSKTVRQFADRHVTFLAL
jgi:hypothetical protein